MYSTLAFDHLRVVKYLYVSHLQFATMRWCNKKGKSQPPGNWGTCTLTISFIYRVTIWCRTNPQGFDNYHNWCRCQSPGIWGTYITYGPLIGCLIYSTLAFDHIRVVKYLYVLPGFLKVCNIDIITLTYHLYIEWLSDTVPTHMSLTNTLINVVANPLRVQAIFKLRIR